MTDSRAQVEDPVAGDLDGQVVAQVKRGEERPVEAVGGGRAFLPVPQDELLLLLVQLSAQVEQLLGLPVGAGGGLGQFRHGGLLRDGGGQAGPHAP